MNVFEIEQLTKRYKPDGPLVNDGISLAIHSAEIFGLLGDNGAGKSTLVKQMVGLLKPSGGRLQFMGQVVGTDSAELTLNIGYMPQETHALNTMTISEALYFTSHLRGLTRHDARQDRDRLLDIWQLQALKNQPSTRLSGGQRRLLRLAVAMCGRPPVLILDEPTNDLDPVRRKLVWDLLRAENSEAGTTIVFITHDAIEAEKIIERVGIMRAGKLVALGKPGQLKKQIADKLRLDLFCEADQLPALPPHLTVQPVQVNHWRLALDWDDVEAVMGVLKSAEIDDLRLTTATLEDLYLHYATPDLTGLASTR